MKGLHVHDQGGLVVPRIAVHIQYVAWLLFEQCLDGLHALLDSVVNLVELLEVLHSVDALHGLVDVSLGDHGVLGVLHGGQGR